MTMIFLFTEHEVLLSGPALAGAGPNARARRGAPCPVALLRHRGESTVL